MKDFLNYTESEDNQPKNGDAFSLFSFLARKYEGKSSEDMMSAIIAEAEKGRKNGTLTDEDIDNFAATISPLLDAKQRKMLSVIVGRLKK